MRLLLFLIISFFIQIASIGQVEEKIKSHSKNATNLACIFPGSGHLYNNKNKPENLHSRLWWKLPIIYGGLASSAYLTYFNNNEFRLIRNERLSRLNNPASYLIQYSDTQLKYLQEDYRRYRDISIIAFLGVYFLQVIDANVESNIFQFDTDDKLSLDFKTNYTGISNQIHVSELSLKFIF